MNKTALAIISIILALCLVGLGIFGYTKINGLNEEINKITADYAELEKTNSELTETNDELSKSYEEAKTLSESMEDELSAGKTEIEALKAQVTELIDNSGEANVTMLPEEVEAVKEKKAEFVLSLDDAYKSANIIVAGAEELGDETIKEEANALTVTLEEMYASIGADAPEASIEEGTLLPATAEEINNGIEEVKTVIEALAPQVEENKAMFKAVSDLTDSENTEAQLLVQGVQIVSAKVDALKEKVTELKEKYSDNTDVLADIETVETDVTSISDTLVNVTGAVNNASIAINNAQKKDEVNQNLIKALEEGNTDLVEQSYQTQIESLNTAVSEYETKISELNTTIKAYEALADEGATLEETVSGLKTEVETLTTSNEALKTENEELTAGNTESDELTKVIEGYEALADEGSTLEETINTLKTQVSDLTEKLAAETKALDELQAEYDAYKQSRRENDVAGNATYTSEANTQLVFENGTCAYVVEAVKEGKQVVTVSLDGDIIAKASGTSIESIALTQELEPGDYSVIIAHQYYDKDGEYLSGSRIPVTITVK